MPFCCLRSSGHGALTAARPQSPQHLLGPKGRRQSTSLGAPGEVTMPKDALWGLGVHGVHLATW